MKQIWKKLLSNLVKIGDELGKLVVATGNIHYLNEEDAIYRKILVGSMGGANPLNRHSLQRFISEPPMKC